MPADASSASEPATTFTPHVRAKRERRRREILHAALEAARERGYQALTLEDIAERLGIRKTALYHYFPDRDAIVLACHRESLAELDRIIERSEAECNGDPASRLAFLIREHVRVMTETLAGSPLAFEVPTLPEPARSEVIARRDRYERLIRELVGEGVRGGRFRPVDPRIAGFAILGAINWIARWYRPGGPVAGPELGRHFADLLLHGLVARPTPPRSSA